jgi:hypothetical protein
LDQATPLAGAVISMRIQADADRLHTVEGKVHAARAASEVVGALPTTEWPARIAELIEKLDVVHETVIDAVFEAAARWDADPLRTAQRLGARFPEPRTPPRSPAQTLAQLLPDGAGDAHWPALLRHAEAAATAGHNVDSRLRTLAAKRPLDLENPVRDLDLRLIEAIPSVVGADLPRAQTHARDSVRAGAANRLAREARDAENRQRRADVMPPADTLGRPREDPSRGPQPDHSRPTPPPPRR